VYSALKYVLARLTRGIYELEYCKLGAPMSCIILKYPGCVEDVIYPEDVMLALIESAGENPTSTLLEVLS
jgi:hypothetical protein